MIRDVRFGSVAAAQHDISPTAASGGNPAVRVANFQNPNLNVCFSQQRPFRAEENHENDGQLTANSGRRSIMFDVLKVPTAPPPLHRFPAAAASRQAPGY